MKLCSRHFDLLLPNLPVGRFNSILRELVAISRERRRLRRWLYYGTLAMHLDDLDRGADPRWTSDWVRETTDALLEDLMLAPSVSRAPRISIARDPQPPLESWLGAGRLELKASSVRSHRFLAKRLAQLRLPSWVPVTVIKTCAATDRRTWRRLQRAWARSCAPVPLPPRLAVEARFLEFSSSEENRQNLSQGMSVERWAYLFGHGHTRVLPRPSANDVQAWLNSSDPTWRQFALEHLHDLLP
jgi:hypothetical protein